MFIKIRQAHSHQFPSGDTVRTVLPRPFLTCNSTPRDELGTAGSYKCHSQHLNGTFLFAYLWKENKKKTTSIVLNVFFLILTGQSIGLSKTDRITALNLSKQAQKQLRTQGLPFLSSETRKSLRKRSAEILTWNLVIINQYVSMEHNFKNKMLNWV